MSSQTSINKQQKARIKLIATSVAKLQNFIFNQAVASVICVMVRWLTIK